MSIGREMGYIYMYIYMYLPYIIHILSQFSLAHFTVALASLGYYSHAQCSIKQVLKYVHRSELLVL